MSELKKMLSLLIAAIMLCMAILPVASAETLERGSKGEEVLDLQQMLFDTGYLSEEPDGTFGKNTETAVKVFQEYAHLEVTGKADDLTMDELTACWRTLMSSIEPAPEADEEEGAFPPFCNTWQQDKQTVVCDYCEVHAQLYADALDILADGSADTALYAFISCQNEILRLYDEWKSRVPETAQEFVENNRTLYLQIQEAQRTAMFNSYDAAGIEIDPTDVYRGMLQWMSSHTAWLCQMLHTLDAEE